MIFRQYDQAGLDAQYNLRVRHPEFQTHFDKWAKESAALRASLPCTLDVAYGRQEGERLDWFPADRANAPVHVFIHGGYWRAMDKSDHSFIVPGLRKSGHSVAVVNYALAPKVTVAEIVRQVRAAVAWVYQNAKSLGADPNRLTVSGHSAGGHLTAMTLLTDWKAFAGLPPDVVKAGLAISGLHDMEPIRLCYLNADLHLTPADDEPLSPIRHTPPVKTPLIVAVGGAETDEFIRLSREFAARRKAQGHPAEYLETPGDNHFTVLEQLARADSAITRALLKMIA